jgi:hypothetical protein
VTPFAFGSLRAPLALQLDRRPVDEPEMRIHVFGVALLAAALSGCWVLDELDEGNKKIDIYTGKGNAPEPEEEVVARPPSGRQRIGEYFANQKNARTLTPGQLSSDIVSCKLKSGTQFMKQSECASRGGIPKS